MGLITSGLNLVFGDGRNAIRDTAEVFRENSETAAERDHLAHQAALAQFADEYGRGRGWFDALIDGVNRLPRPFMAIGTIGLFVSAMIDPIWFASRMQGIALVPEPLWWLLGAIVSFYFGARHQEKGQKFQRQIAGTLALAPSVVANLKRLEAVKKEGGVPKVTSLPKAPIDSNQALDLWRAGVGADLR